MVATAHGLRASLLCQAVEWPDLRESVTSGSDHAHMLVRLGYGPEGPVSPRWAARTVLAAGRVSG
ncbi:hypothetical protein [Streptomyces sp. NPDC054940]